MNLCTHTHTHSIDRQKKTRRVEQSAAPAPALHGMCLFVYNFYYVLIYRIGNNGGGACFIPATEDVGSVGCLFFAGYR